MINRVCRFSGAKAYSKKNGFGNPALNPTEFGSTLSMAVATPVVVMGALGVGCESPTVVTVESRPALVTASTRALVSNMSATVNTLRLWFSAAKRSPKTLLTPVAKPVTTRIANRDAGIARVNLGSNQMIAIVMTTNAAINAKAGPRM